MKRNYIYIIILTIVFGFVYIQIFDAKIDLNGDNVHYLKLGENIAKGHGYVQLTPNGEIPASHYPPGYSAFMAIFMFLGIKNMVFFKVLNGVLLLLSLIGLYYLVNKITKNKALSLSGALLAIFSPKILEFSTMVMSEMFFLFCSVIFFISLYQYSRQNKQQFWTSPWFYISILAVVIAYYTRTVGAALLFALLIFYSFRKEWWQAGSSLLAFVLLNIPWSLRNAHHGIESRYLGTIMTVNPWRPESGTISSVSEMIDKMLVNFDETVIKGFKEILFPFMTINYETASGFMAIIGGLMILAIVLYGAYNFASLKWATIAYLIAQIGLFMLWHGGNGSRYVVPIAPIIFVSFYVGVYKLLRLFLKKETKLTTLLPYAFLIVVFWMFEPVEIQAKRAKQPLPAAYQNYFNIAKEMQKQFPKNTVCCCRKPELFAYYAENIYAVNYIYTLDSDALIQDLIQKEVDYVVLEQLGYGSTARYLYPAIVAHQELFPVVGQIPNPDTYLLKFEREKAKEKLLAKVNNDDDN